MKKLLLAGIFLFLGAFALTAQNLPTIKIVNNTGSTIYYIFISPSESDIWGEELLGEDVLEDGQTFTCQLPEPLSKVRVYDFGVEDEDGEAYYKWDVTITNNAQIVFTFDDLE